MILKPLQNNLIKKLPFLLAKFHRVKSNKNTKKKERKKDRMENRIKSHKKLHSPTTQPYDVLRSHN